SCGNHHPIHHGLGIDKFGAGGLNVWLESRIRGSATTFKDACSKKRERRGTKLRDRLFLVEEMSDDLAEVFVVANVFGRSSTRNDQRYIVSRIHIFESEVGVPRIAGLLGVGIESRLEIVDHETQLLLR